MTSAGMTLHKVLVVPSGLVDACEDQPSEYAQKILVHFFEMQTFKADIPGGSAMGKEMRRWMRTLRTRGTEGTVKWDPHLQFWADWLSANSQVE